MNLHERIEWKYGMTAIARDGDGYLYQYPENPAWEENEWKNYLSPCLAIPVKKDLYTEIEPGQGITIDGEWFYAPGHEPDVMANAGEEGGMQNKYVLVTTDWRGVFAGELVREDEINRILTLENARGGIEWMTAAGLLDLACAGPSKNSVVGSPVLEIKVHGVTSIIVCTDEARSAWEGHVNRGRRSNSHAIETYCGEGPGGK